MLIVGAIAIGFAPIGLRLSAFEPQATGFWRFLFASMIAAVIYATGGKLGRPSRMALIAGTFFGLDITFWHASLVMTSVANATFLVNLGNAAVGLAAGRAKMADEIWLIALSIALLGLPSPREGNAGPTPGALEGDALALLAAVMVGLYLFFAGWRDNETAMQEERDDGGDAGRFGRVRFRVSMKLIPPDSVLVHLDACAWLSRMCCWARG